MIKKFFQIVGFCCVLCITMTNLVCMEMPAWARQSMDVIEKHVGLLEIGGALMHVPYILTLDSDDADHIAYAACPAALPTMVKIAGRFVAKKDAHFYEFLMWYLPMFTGYLSSLGYDFINIKKDSEETIKMRKKSLGDKKNIFKIHQAICLGLEVFLRIISYAEKMKTNPAPLPAGGLPHTYNSLSLDKCVVVVADLLELWRLLSRFYLMNGAFIFSIELDKKQEIQQPAANLENATSASAKTEITDNAECREE